MNQIVPQLLLGEVLSGSTGPPDYNPIYSTFSTWMFGAHYFFEVFNASTQQVDAKAAYGGLFPALEGETISTSFDVYAGPFGPAWHVKMGVVGDATRVSEIFVEQPYMGIGKDWPIPSVSWAVRFPASQPPGNARKTVNPAFTPLTLPHRRRISPMCA
jgi:hypothetical protein